MPGHCAFCGVCMHVCQWCAVCICFCECILCICQYVYVGVIMMWVFITNVCMCMYWCVWRGWLFVYTDKHKNIHSFILDEMPPMKKVESKRLFCMCHAFQHLIVTQSTRGVRPYLIRLELFGLSRPVCNKTKHFFYSHCIVHAKIKELPPSRYRADSHCRQAQGKQPNAFTKLSCRAGGK